MEPLDQPSTRARGRERGIILALAAAAAAFHLFAAGVAPFTALVQRPVHLGLMALLGFLGVGVRPSRGAASRRTTSAWVSRRTVGTVLTALLLGGVVFGCAYMVAQQETLVRRAGNPTAVDLVAGLVTIVLVLELARRSTGWGLLTVALLALAYGVLGPYLPGLLAHRGYGPSRIIQHLYLSTEGIWGVPLGVSADFVYLFVLFGGVLEVAGGGQLLIAVASHIAGRTRGGPAKTAAVASAIMGSLSGSAVANVVTTGSLTIPLMRRTGFRAHMAAAIEAAASTGGQLMPPVMGAGAFILATWTNIPYVRVAVAAAVPAALYYLALFMAVHFRAGKRGLAGLPETTDEPVLGRLHLLVPLLVIVVLLAIGRSPMRAAFWGVVSAAVATLLGATTRLSLRNVGDALVAAASGTVQVAAACAAAGIVVGIASLTGIGLRMSEFIVALSGGHLPIALFLTAIGSIVLGMGLPTTAAYVVLAALGAPALIELGLPVLAAHLFIFYFGCLSNVTPPVALAAYAGAGLAGSPPMLTAFTAMGLAGAGFVVPFMFTYDPGLLLGGPTGSILQSVVTAGVGVTALSAAVVGFASRNLRTWERAALMVGALGLLAPGVVPDVFGLVVVGFVWVRAGREMKEADETQR